MVVTSVCVCSTYRQRGVASVVAGMQRASLRSGRHGGRHASCVHPVCSENPDGGFTSACAFARCTIITACIHSTSSIPEASFAGWRPAAQRSQHRRHWEEAAALPVCDGAPAGSR
eukprot:15460971-Alexandrium_andersonii.AAC.2